MSKKDKKRIAELERQQSILSATVRVMREEHDYLSRCYHEDKFEQGSTPKSEPKQPEAAKDNPTMDGAKLDSEQVDFVLLGRDFSKSSMGMLKSMIQARGKTKCAGCQNIENILNKFKKLEDYLDVEYVKLETKVEKYEKKQYLSGGFFAVSGGTPTAEWSEVCTKKVAKKSKSKKK